VNANKHEVVHAGLEMCQKHGSCKTQGIFSCCQNAVFELQLFPQFRKVFLVEIESIGVSADVKQLVGEKFFGVASKSVVEEISVVVVFKQRLPTLCNILLQIAHCVHFQLASVENCRNSGNLDLEKFWLHPVVLAEIPCCGVN